MKIEERLLTLMAEEQMTQYSLAKEMYLSVSTINGYVKGRRMPDIETAARLAAFFHTSLDYLTGYSNIRDTFPITQKEGTLLSNYRALDESQKQLLECLSANLRKSVPCTNHAG